MTRHTRDRAFEPLECNDPPNSAEQARNDVVASIEIKVRHVGTRVVAGRGFQPRGAQVVFIIRLRAY